MKLTEKSNKYLTTNKKLLDACHDGLKNVHFHDHVTKQKSKQRHWSFKLADFHNQSPLLTMRRWMQERTQRDSTRTKIIHLLLSVGKFASSHSCEFGKYQQLKVKYSGLSRI